MTSRKLPISALLCALTLSAAATPALACIHAASLDAKARPVKTSAYQALIIPGQGVQHTFITAGIDASSPPVERLAWIIPVPATPKSVSTGDPGLFAELDRYVGLKHEAPRTRSRAPKGAKSAGMSTSAAVLMRLPESQAGPYRIQPLKATGEAGVKAMSLWLNKNRFAPLDTGILKHYAAQGWTFLAVSVSPAPGKKTITPGNLPPLHIVTARPADQLVYPTRILTAAGEAAVRITLLTPEPLSYSESKRVALTYGLSVAAGHYGSSVRSRCAKSVYTHNVSAIPNTAHLPAALKKSATPALVQWPNKTTASLTVLYEPNMRCIKASAKHGDLRVKLLNANNQPMRFGGS